MEKIIGYGATACVTQVGNELLKYALMKRNFGHHLVKL